MSTLHPLDQLCLVSRVQYATNFTATKAIPVCRDLEHLCQEMYWTANMYLHETGLLLEEPLPWHFTIDITEDPTVAPLRLTMQIPGEVFREGANVVVPCLMRTMRDIYDGKYGSDKVQTGGAPLMSWEDLL